MRPYRLLLIALVLPALLPAQSIDRDLLEVIIPQLEQLYAAHRYTVTQVVQWYLARISRYDGIYGAVCAVDEPGALAVAASEDAEAMRGGTRLQRGAMWGVPIVIKANTSIKGLITSDGWKGFVIPGHELVAPVDATVVGKFRVAGAVILGQTNLPDFAASDTTRSSAFGRTGNAYDVRFSPGGSSGGTVTAVSANFALLGTGTDTSNSIRMPSSTSAVIGVLPTRGLVSIAGIAPLDWLLDDTGPIARDVTDAAIALGVMAGEDPLDFRTKGSATKAQARPYTQYLKKDALQGKRFGVPAFILNPKSPPRPETRDIFLKAVEDLRAAGATVVIENSILPASFLEAVDKIKTFPYHLEGFEAFLKNFGPAEYKSVAEYAEAVGSPLSPMITMGPANSPAIEADPAAETNFFGPQRDALAMYNATLDRLQLDGFVYPAAQMPPPDETMPQDGRLSSGPHSQTGWINPIGVPAVVVVGGFYASGLPFGLEISARQWKDGDLLGWAYAYEQATHHRHPPVLVDQGLLPKAK
jgi:Asp-tRNA(Asn)/Glu-tRNA(Gln) amidotransferase A subunit family amidase